MSPLHKSSPREPPPNEASPLHASPTHNSSPSYTSLQQQPMSQKPAKRSTSAETVATNNQTASGANTATAVVVPIRSFDGALSRLEATLGRSGCSELMRRMASRVVTAADGLPVHIASNDAEVTAWAHNRAVSVVKADRPGLSAAVTKAVQQLASAGVSRVVVAHADLARVRSLRHAVGIGLVIAPDRWRDGSNVICVDADSGFQFSYGPGSFQRHLAEAARLGLEVTVLRDDTLAYDIDQPEDLLELSEDERVDLGIERSVVCR